MKKILLAALSLTLSVLFFAGCTAQASVLVIKAKWYDNLAEENVVSINERLVYDISFIQDDTSATKIRDFEGEYTAALTTQKADGADVYLLSSEIITSGTYYQEGETDIPFADEVNSEVVFKGLKHSLYPVSAQKSYDGYGYSPFGEKLSERIKKYAYDFETIYNGNKASVNFSKAENMSLVSKTQSYSKISKKHNYFDNEQLLFIIRALELKEKFSQTFSVINAINGELQTVIVSVAQESPYSELEIKGLSENGVVSDKKLPVIKVTITLNAKMSGSSFICYYAAEKNKENSYYSRLIKMEQDFPGNVGKLVYTLNTVIYNPAE